MKQPQIMTPDGIFSSSARYKAPVFQRLYVWGEKQLEDMFEDIANADRQTGQFLGALVLKDLGRSKGPTSPTEYLIIDGQQRLTTLYLLLLGIADIAATYGEHDAARFITETYLGESRGAEYHGWPKLVPTLQDRHALWKLLAKHAPSLVWNFQIDGEDLRRRDTQKVIVQWGRIVAKLEAELIDDDGKLRTARLHEIFTAVQNQLNFICITLDDSDDANRIFDRLNAKGVPLELVDLVRNEIFSKFLSRDSEKVDEFYRNKWHPFEKSFPKDSVKRFFTTYSYIAFDGRVTKSNAFAELQQRWRTQEPAEILSGFERYSPYYRMLVEFRRNQLLPKDVNLAVERFSRMPQTTVTWPFLVTVLEATAGNTLALESSLGCLEIVESFLVRRALVGVEPTGLHAVFKNLWSRTKGEPSVLLEKIVTRTIQCPSDKELREALSSERVDTRAILRYVLAEYEREFVRAKKFDLAACQALTIEHVLPQNRSGPWKEEFSVRDHQECYGLIGNIALLSAMQNKSLQDEGWPAKRERFRGSDFKTTRELADHDKWSKRLIRERGTKLVTWIVNRWPSLQSFKKRIEQ